MSVTSKISTESSLFAPIIRFLIGLAGGGRDKCAAKAVFNYVDKKILVRDNCNGWQSFLQSIEEFSCAIGSPLAPANPYSQRRHIDDEERDIHIAINRPKVLAIMHLICATIDPESAEKLYSIDPVTKLFGLLLTPVPLELKGDLQDRKSVV